MAKKAPARPKGAQDGPSVKARNEGQAPRGPGGKTTPPQFYPSARPLQDVTNGKLPHPYSQAKRTPVGYEPYVDHVVD